MSYSHPDLLPDPEEPAEPETDPRAGKCICHGCCSISGMGPECRLDATQEDGLCGFCRKALADPRERHCHVDPDGEQSRRYLLSRRGGFMSEIRFMP
jgi:hypothetical protein